MLKCKLLLIAIFCFAILQSKCQAQSQSENTITAVQEQSLLFKSLEGQERKSVFEKLKTAIKTESQKMCNSNAASFIPSSKQDVISLLGNPSKELSITNLSYFLSNDKRSGQVNFIFDGTGKLLSYSLSDKL